MRWLLLTLLLAATTATAGDRRQRPYNRFNASVSFNTGWVSTRPAPRVVVEPIYVVPLAWWTWYPVYQQPLAPPPPVVIEREVIREVPAPAPAPQIIIIEQPAPAPVVEAPAPPPTPAPAPVAEAPKPPLGPRVPGPDVFTWLDQDGVTHYSTRVPSSVKARAKKVGSASK